MDIRMLTRFFMWCTILNMGLLVLSFVVRAFSGDFAYRLHSRWFPMPRRTFNTVVYSLLGVYKIIIPAFNVAPSAALAVVG